jgi:hypothetical protein
LKLFFIANWLKTSCSQKKKMALGSERQQKQPDNFHDAWVTFQAFEQPTGHD